MRLAIEEEWPVWEALGHVPLMILMSPFVAFFVGVGVDCGFVAKGKYAHDAGERIDRPWYYMPGH